jgi:hypothetical protein
MASIVITPEDTRSVVTVNSVNNLALNQDGSVELLNKPAGQPTGSQLMPVGSFGLGNSNNNHPTISNIDLNTNPIGFWKVVNGTTTGTFPSGLVGGTWGNMLITATVHGATQLYFQSGTQDATQPVFYRNYNIVSAAWDSWQRIATSNTAPNFLNTTDKYINHGFVAGGTLTMNPLLAADQSVWWTASGTIAFNTSTMPNESNCVLNVQIIGTDTFTTTWPAGIYWPNGAVPTRTGICTYTLAFRKDSAGNLTIFGYQSAKNQVAV